MSRYLHLLLIGLLALTPRPGFAQDSEDDEDTEIEVNDDDADEGGMSEEELEEIRKKNAGLAGGGKSDEGDPGAPKLEKSLQDQVNEAIKRGVEWLKKAQNKDGSWDPVTANRDYKTGKDVGTRVRDELGTTAWSVYTLAKCGVKKSDPAIKKGLKYIFDQTKYSFDELGGEPARGSDGRQTPSRKSPRSLTTYEAAAIIMMIEAVYEQSAKLTGQHKKRRLFTDNPLKLPDRSKIPKKIWRYMHNRILWLTTGRRGAGGRGRTIRGLQATAGDNAGGWRYQNAGNDADLSATQFALLALRAASQAGYPVEKTAKDVWLKAAQYVAKCQTANGGFVYQIGNPQNTGSMAACGVGCLLICKEQMELAGQTPPAWIDERVEKGLAWLDENFAVDRNPGGAHHFYYLYGVERVGDLTGRHEFGGKDWYVRGARMLIAQQAPDGQWTDGTAFPPHNVNGTCFALLFLKRATIPTITISGN